MASTPGRPDLGPSNLMYVSPTQGASIFYFPPFDGVATGVSETRIVISPPIRKQHHHHPRITIPPGRCGDTGAKLHD